MLYIAPACRGMMAAVSTRKLPQFDSIQELAKFWDSHDLADFEDQFEEVTETVFEREATITLHLQSDEAQVVRDMAKSKGVADEELVREWVLEKIHSS